MSIAAILLSAAVAASPVVTASDAKCSIEGYNADKDMTGTNIRSAPDAKAPVVYRMMPEKEPDDTYGAEFEAIGSKNGWLLIRNVELGSYGDGNAKIVFKGPGWIAGSLVGLLVADRLPRRLSLVAACAGIAIFGVAYPSARDPAVIAATGFALVTCIYTMTMLGQYAYVPELYGTDAYREIVAHIGRLTGRPSFVADGMRPCEFNYRTGPAADQTEAGSYRAMFETLLASPWFLGGTVCEYRPRIPEFSWYAEEPTTPRSGVRRADYSERDPLFATFQELHASKHRARLARLGGAGA